RAPSNTILVGRPGSPGTSYGALVPGYRHCEPTAAGSQPYIVVSAVGSIVKAGCTTFRVSATPRDHRQVSHQGLGGGWASTSVIKWYEELTHEQMNGGDKPIRVLVADDHALLREGIAALIGAESDMQLVAEAATGREAITQFKLKRPDVTLMDLQMPDIGGIEAIIAIRGEFPNAR